ncbi:hypothetical protein Tco_0247576 [Tanacetum coccineum]
MTSMKYRDKHNQVGFLKKPEESARFAEIVDFLKVSYISKLQLADALGISMLPNTEIFKGLGNMGYPTYVPPPPTSQHAPTKSTTIPPTLVTEPTSEPSSPSTAPKHETMEHPFEHHHLNTNHLHLDKNLTFHKPRLLLIRMRQK